MSTVLIRFAGFPARHARGPKSIFSTLLVLMVASVGIAIAVADILII